jgi:phosphatidate cytidylyltransferase
MAFNKQVFKTRALSAVLFAIVMLLGIFWNHWSFFILFSVIHFGCWLEYQKLVSLIDPGYAEITPFHKYGVMIAGWCFMLWFSGAQYAIGGLRLHELGWWLGLIFFFLLPITELLFTSNIRLRNIAHSAFGLLYISLSWGLLIDLTSFVPDLMVRSGSVCPFTSFDYIPILFPSILILSMWVNDTMAYIVGSLIGKTPFSPISPKKTWEGTIGGILLCILAVGFLFSSVPTDIVLPGVHYEFPKRTWFIIAGVAAIAGTAGDLLESKIKRLAGVKDSGSLMPGHGGFLDRFDSLLLAIPFVWLYVKLFV